jgi:hypothetical protein
VAAALAVLAQGCQQLLPSEDPGPGAAGQEPPGAAAGQSADLGSDPLTLAPWLPLAYLSLSLCHAFPAAAPPGWGASQLAAAAGQQLRRAAGQPHGSSLGYPLALLAGAGAGAADAEHALMQGRWPWPVADPLHSPDSC